MEDMPTDVVKRLRTVSTATLTMQLLKRGLRHVWMDGPQALDPGLGRIAGEAFTFRFVPMREDISTPESYLKPNSIRQAIESLPRGRVVVIDSRGERGCGTLGDILMARLQARGATAVVTDGAMRDTDDIRDLAFPVFCTGAAAPPSIARLAFAGWEQPIGCGGVAVFPGDLVVGDADGVVVVPRALAQEVAGAAVEQERFERFAQAKVKQGAPVVGLYPPNEETLAEYARWVEDEPPVK